MRQNAIWSLIDRDYAIALDAGCGNGRDFQMLLKHAQKLVGVDFSPGMVKGAKFKAAKLDTCVYLAAADVTNLPFKDGSFDISFHADFYIYFQNNDILRLFKEQKRVTKDLMIIFVHSKYNGYRLPFWYQAKIKKDPWYEIRAYSLKELRNIFDDQEILASGGVDSYILDLVNTVGKGFIGRPICPKLLRDRINKIEFFRRPLFWEIIYIVIKVD